MAEEKVRVEVEIGENLKQAIYDILQYSSPWESAGSALRKALRLDLTKVVEVAIKREVK